MWVYHTLKGNEKGLPKLGARLKARDSSSGFAEAGISCLGPVRWRPGAGPKRAILSQIDLRESPALSLAPRVYQSSFSE